MAKYVDRPRKLITVDELASLWSVPKTTLYNWVFQKRLPYVELGRSPLFSFVSKETLTDTWSVSELFQ